MHHQKTFLLTVTSPLSISLYFPALFSYVSPIMKMFLILFLSIISLNLICNFQTKATKMISVSYVALNSPTKRNYSIVRNVSTLQVHTYIHIKYIM